MKNKIVLSPGVMGLLSFVYFLFALLSFVWTVARRGGFNGLIVVMYFFVGLLLLIFFSIITSNITRKISKQNISSAQVSTLAVVFMVTTHLFVIITNSAHYCDNLWGRYMYQVYGIAACLPRYGWVNMFGILVFYLYLISIFCFLYSIRPSQTNDPSSHKKTNILLLFLIIEIILIVGIMFVDYQLGHHIGPPSIVGPIDF